MTKFTKRLTAVIMTAAMATSMAVSASAASTETWYLQTVQGAPTSVEKYEYRGTVTGLVNITNTGVYFEATAYTDPENADIFARCDVVDHGLKLYEDEFAFIREDYDFGTVLFQQNWYTGCHGTVDFNVEAENFTSGKNQRIAGEATGFPN